MKQFPGFINLLYETVPARKRPFRVRASSPVSPYTRTSYVEVCSIAGGEFIQGDAMPNLIDPRTLGPRPPFSKQMQSHPGTERDLDPPADHGETSYTGSGKLADRVAIITGADSGIGRATAIAFAREGADIVMSYLPEEEADASQAAAIITDSGRKVVKVPGDLKSAQYAESLVETANKHLGGLHIIVNNAAYQMTRENIDEVSPEEFEHTFQTNVFGLFYLTRAALPLLKAGSVILNTTSIQAYEPSENLLAYASTKAAIANLTKGLSKIAGKQGVRVNAVAPGPVWTPLIPATMPTEKVQSFGENTLFERPAQPIEIARIFVFLASDEASYVTGEIFGATGGRTPF